MAQNRSSAVMQQRLEPHDSLDDFPTPPWATRALCEALDGIGFAPRGVVREPAANRGHMVRPLAEAFDQVEASDIFDYGAGYPVRDYLFGPDPVPVDWTITNPPFRLAEQFIARARATSREGCAFILRSAFLEGVGRYERLFADSPPSYVFQFTERVVMHKGKLSAKSSTATAYCWLVWLADPVGRTQIDLLFAGGAQFHWIAPCRKRLERPGDYPVSPEKTAPETARSGGMLI